MDTAGLYHRVMRDVLARSKKEFAAEHLSENILGKLATLWEEKLLNGLKSDNSVGCVQPTSSTIDPVHATEDKSKRCREAEEVEDSPKKRIKTSGLVNETAENTVTKTEESELSSDSEDLQGLSDLDSTDILLGQFEKVSHTKSKWKCLLKDGICTMNGRDMAFSRALGEFKWS